MIIPLYIAVALTAVTAGVGVAAIVNAVRLNREKHGERTDQRNVPASPSC
jgi:hypothetical protein